MVTYESTYIIRGKRFMRSLRTRRTWAELATENRTILHVTMAVPSHRDYQRAKRV
jgi:hypothetical protein